MEVSPERLNYRKTSIIGLGYFSINVTLCLYGPFVPLLLNHYTNSKFIIGLITTMGYLIGALLQPYFGAMSDKTSNRFGRRKPFLLIGMPLSALFFVLIPFEGSFLSLILFIIGFNFMLSVYRVPAMSVMADQTPSKFWNKANGIINFIGGIGALIAYFVGSILYEMDKHYPFILVGIILLVCVAVINTFIDEKSTTASKSEEEHVGVLAACREIIKDKDKSAVLLLLSLFLRFMGYSGVETFLTLYGTDYLHVTPGSAAILLGIMALSFIVFAIPSGILASKIGKKKTITIGLLLMLVAFLVNGIFQSFLVIAIMSPIGGIGYALININAYPMLLDMAGTKKIGVYTGLYYFAFSISAIVAPPMFGKFIDMLGYGVMFYISCILLLGALLCFIFVKGDAMKHENI